MVTDKPTLPKDFSYPTPTHPPPNPTMNNLNPLYSMFSLLDLGGA